LAVYIIVSMMHGHKNIKFWVSLPSLWICGNVWISYIWKQ